eukprot:TRINITY_DN3805_c0_g1_i10.p1 TRINITY_DN3805_c0_g1~~TRINITY_DN3805_c0_g1_i10.p1  ORF type:complete len:366 (+),score=86.73 TRINITY_DN3805_c0_g1_i10:74-1171(+)
MPEKEKKKKKEKRSVKTPGKTPKAPNCCNISTARPRTPRSVPDRLGDEKNLELVLNASHDLRPLTRHDITSRDYLFLGCGSFEFEVSFVQRFPWLGKRMVASDHIGTWQGARDRDTATNIDILRDCGVLVGALDASRLPRGVAFTWVQFNCPCGVSKTAIPEVMERLFDWASAGGLRRDGTLHISCHGGQKTAQQQLQLPKHARRTGHVLVNANDSLRDRYRYTPRRTNLGRFQSPVVYEYVFKCRTGHGLVEYTDNEGYFNITKINTLPVEPSVAEEEDSAELDESASAEFIRRYTATFDMSNASDQDAYCDFIFDAYGEDAACMAGMFVDNGCPGLGPGPHTRFEIEWAEELFWEYNGSYNSD